MMELIAFTICSNNYFAFAKVLATSWLNHHPDSRFVIFLVDYKSDIIDYDFHLQVDVWPLDNLNLPNLDQLVSQYDITELNTAVKADAFLSMFASYANKKIVYLDPDVQVFSPFTEVAALLDKFNIIVTPHYCTPIDDGLSTTDIKMMGSGLYNLGFIALANFEKVLPFLNWWRERLYKYAYYDLPHNMFYDQAWLNYVTVFFDDYYILKHPGYNVANWNFHERQLSTDKDGHYYVNEKFALKFFHFSGYKLKDPDRFAFYHTRYTFETRPDMASFYNSYRKLLFENGAAAFEKIPCVYFERHKLLQAEKELLKWAATPFKNKVIQKAANLARTILYNRK